MTIGQRIKSARAQAQMSQSELARAIGVRPQSVQHWEKDTSAPRNHRINALAGALGCDEVWLQTGQHTARVGEDSGPATFYGSRAAAQQETRDEPSAIIDISVLRNIFDELDLLWGDWPDDNDYLAYLVSEGYRRSMLSMRDAGRQEIHTILSKAFRQNAKHKEPASDVESRSHESSDE